MRGVALTALVAGLVGCAHAAQPTVGTAPPNPSNASAGIHLVPLADLVPAAGLRWVVELSPRELLADPTVISALPTLFPEAELDAMARTRGGVDLRTMRTFVAAGYDASTVYLAAAIVDPPKLEAAFSAQVAEVMGRAIDAPSNDPRETLIRLWGGSGREHTSVVIFGREAAGLAVGPDAPLRASEGFALGKLKRAKPAWKSAPLDELGKRLGEAPIRAGAPGPFAGEWALGLEGLLGSATAVGAAARIDGDALRVTGVILGPWGARAGAAEQRVERSYQALAGSGLGRLLGVDRPATPVVFKGEEDSVTVEVRWSIGPLVRGLRDATATGVQEMMQGVSGR